MTSTETVPTWPKIDALTRPDGSGEVTINGTSHPIETNSIEDARSAILARVTETAAKMQRAVRVTTAGPDGEWPLIVHPDGTVEEDPETAAKPAPEAVDDTTLPPVDEATVPAPGAHAAPAAFSSAPIVPAAPQFAPVPQQPSYAPQAPAAPVYGGAPQQGNEWVRSSAAPPVDQEQPQSRRAARQSFLTQEQVEEPATQGWRGLLTNIGIRMTPSESERAERSDVQAVSQHWPGPRTIAIVNGKGGAGKTPTTVLLAAVFARYGGAGVLTWDNNQTRGTLGWRTEQGPHEATLLELLPQVDRLLSTGAQSADLAHYVHHQTRDRFDVLRSKPMALAHEQRVEPEDVDAIHAVAAKYYRLIFIDSGNDESDPMWLRMIDHTDQLVVATTTRDDHAEAGALLLEGLAERDERSAQLAQRAVVVVNQADPKAVSSDLARVAEGYSGLARAAVTVPHDPAMVDGVLRYGSLRPSTQRAWLRAGAAVANGL